MTTWLSLVDYSNKYKVSISTLRRKIKIEDIPFRLDSGKYYIIDEPMMAMAASSGSQLELEKPAAPDKTLAPATLTTSKREIEIPELDAATVRAPMHEGGESVLVAANRLLDEIKKAYTLILQEKDEQIRQLRGEITDLKTLVRVLEGESERLKQNKNDLYFE
jgi:hypothetical protein